MNPTAIAAGLEEIRHLRAKMKQQLRMFDNLERALWQELHMESATVAWSRDMLKRFERRYDMALTDKRETFTFEGHTFVVAYAKYLIEHLNKELYK